MRALLAVLLLSLFLTTFAVAQDNLDATFRQPPIVEPGLVQDIVPDTPLARADEPFDPAHTLMMPGVAPAYLVTPATTPAMLRGLVLQNAALGDAAYFGSRLSDGTPVTDQPYWEQAKGLATVRSRALSMAAAGDRQTQAVIVQPWADPDEIEDFQLRALRDVANYLASIQVGYIVVPESKLGALAQQNPRPKAVFLPAITATTAATPAALNTLAEGGAKVVAVGDLPAGPEGGGAWVEELFGYASLDDLEEPVAQKGNAVVCPAELSRLNPMLNGIRAEELFMYPPWTKVVCGHFVAEGGETDWYLLYNSGNAACHTYLTIYRLCAPELWSIDTGAVRPAPGYKHTDEGTTLVPLALEPEDALIVMCKPPLAADKDSHITQAPGLERVGTSEKGGKTVVTGLARLNGTHTVMLADGRKGKTKVEGLPTRLIIDGGWSLSLEEPFDRQPTLISRAKVRVAPEGDDTAPWAAADFDDIIWDTVNVGDPLPALAPKWKAKWLTYGGDGEVRHFRKVFELTEGVKSATVSATADNAYQLYVNGEKLGQDGDWYKAETYDIAGKLKPGKNVIAARVDNEGSAAGFLCEALVTLESGELLQIATDASWRMVNGPGEGWEAADFDDSGWDDPEVGGSPPSAGPWGNIPGLPEKPNTGSRIWYRFDIPSSTEKLTLPAGASPVALYVGGKEVAFDGPEADLSKVDVAGRVALVIAGPNALAEPVVCESGGDQIMMGDWKTQGLAGYAGVATYERTLTLPPEYARERLFLDLGEVGAVARVAVNGKDLGPRSRPPFVFDLGNVKKPKVKLRITVANTLDEAAPAGLLGPIVLRPYRAVEVEL